MIINYSSDKEKEKDILNDLKLLRERWGDFNQLIVTIEELSELSAIISKIVRYNSIEDAKSNIGENILDEIADTLIVLDHIINICNFNDNEIQDRIYKKMTRVKRWIDSNKSQKITTIDRSVGEIE